MEAALARALKLWEEGASGDPGILNEAVVPWIEAACRRAQRRFPEALKRIDEALVLDGGALRGKILLSKSAILATVGDQEGMTEVLAEAAPLIDERKEPLIAVMLRFNLAVGLTMSGRAVEAELRLREVRRLAEQLGEELSLVRVVWLQGKVDAELGRTGEAMAAFQQVRRDFGAHELTFEYALVSLDLSHALLKEGRTAEVRVIAEEVLLTFTTQEIQREAFAALQIFCEAAKREAASVELARRVIEFLHRAQLDPELRFEETEGAEA
jgi:tetratricopeptide (TPR) repeat protein